jgi:hypothetical protein
MQAVSQMSRALCCSNVQFVNFMCIFFFFSVAESLVQELELERKSRQHQAAERDQVKSPLQGALEKNTKYVSSRVRSS